MWMTIFVLGCCSVLPSSIQKSTAESDTYVAAVVEYSPLINSNGLSAPEVISKHLENYVKLIGIASEKHADIIVFPEAAINSELTSEYFNSTLPSPDDRVNPCMDTSSDVAEGIRVLSCAALKYEIYVVINIYEIITCTDVGNTCPSSGMYYNSNVAFDRQGYVVARYRKFNLFGEARLSVTSEPEYSMFETDFGVKFGMFICFDIQFAEPALQLVKKYGITDIVFPTYWFSELPFLTAVQAQASWAHAMDVNLLASGVNYPSKGSTGSGIYAGTKGPLINSMLTSPATELLLATVPKRNAISNHSNPACERIRNPLQNDQPINSNNSKLFMKQDYLLPYETTLLTEDLFNSKHVLCQNRLCCNFEVSMHKEHNTSNQDYFYRLVVFDGVRSYSNVASGGLQICAMVFCANKSISSCGVEITNPLMHTKFDHIHISGSFILNNSYQFPDTLVDEYGVLPSDIFMFVRQETVDDGRVEITMETTVQDISLMTFGIFGRDFAKDGLPMTIVENNFDKASFPLVINSTILFIFSFLLLMVIDRYLIN